MADIEFTPDVAQDQTASVQGGGLGALANVAGALISLALMAGVGVWAYKLMVRDVSGVPVVRALDGPMRVQPVNPGGRPADHQGLAVNAVAADGSAEAPADTLILAPRPVDLAEEDTPAPELARPAAQPVEEPVQQTVETAEATTTQADEIEALVAQITANVAAPSTQERTEAAIVVPEPVVVEVAAANPVPSPSPAIGADVPGVASSVRPQRRPANVARSRVIQTSAPATPTALDIDPADVPAGTRVVQLGAYESGDVARSEWDRLSARFGDYMQGKQRIVQQASSGGRTFYRLRVHGFDDLSDARRFCSALVAEGADCIPVVTR